MADEIHGGLAFFTCHGAHGDPRVELRFDATASAGDAALTDGCLSSFCFPVVDEMRQTRSYATDAEHYCFVVTNARGERTHGFCRRIYWSATPMKPKFPIVLCLLSNDLWSIFYYKLLEVLEYCLRAEKILKIPASPELPLSSIAVQVLREVNTCIQQHSAPGARFTVTLPSIIGHHKIQPAQTIHTLHGHVDKLQSTDGLLEFQVPPLTGGSPEMAGVGLARLLWRIPVECLLTLIASLLFERRIIMISTSKHTLSAAVHAASALIYPFEWVSTSYLPLMPEKLRDYLQAPFPFLVGLPAQISNFAGLEMDDVTIVDLDRGTCVPEPGSPDDDAYHLPRRQQLQNDLHEAVKALRSPAEFEGNERIAQIMTTYIIRLFKHYRDFIRPQTMTEIASMKDRGCFCRGRAKGAAAAAATAMTMSDDENTVDASGIIGHNYYFDHTKFVASHKSKGDRNFLEMLRQSQMYEVFIRQRLEMASLGEYPKDDPFENQINLINEHTAKLKPGQRPYRMWSRLSRAHLSRKFGSISEAPYRRAQTLVKLPEHETDETMLVPKEEVTKRGRPRLRPRGLSGKTIRTIVLDMAKESQKQLGKMEPGNFLRRSRASFVEHGLDSPPSEEEAALSVIMSEKSDVTLMDEAETSANHPEPSSAAAAPEAQIAAPDGPDLLSLSPEDDLNDPLDLMDLFDPAFDPEADDDYVAPLEEQPIDYVSSSSAIRPSHGLFTSAVGPERSFRLDASAFSQLGRRSPPLSKEDKAAAFANSNLKQLESTSSLKLGVVPKPRTQTSTSQMFGRCDAFSLNREK